MNGRVQGPKQTSERGSKTLVANFEGQCWKGLQRGCIYHISEGIATEERDEE